MILDPKLRSKLKLQRVFVVLVPPWNGNIIPTPGVFMTRLEAEHHAAKIGDGAVALEAQIGSYDKVAALAKSNLRNG